MNSLDFEDVELGEKSSSLKSVAKEYKDLVDELENLKSKVKVKKDKFEALIAPMVEKVKNVEDSIEAKKKEIEESVLVEFEKDRKVKKFYGGFGVQEKETLTYEADAALKWAKEHNLCLLLDNKAFEALAKTQELDFVTKKDIEKVTFPKEVKL